MGIYFNKINVNIEFESKETITENQFSKPALIGITIVVRDSNIGRGGSRINHGPSIKIKGKDHANDGDPIYFTHDNKPIFDYRGRVLLKRLEEKYLRNFIIHNYINLVNYWNAGKDLNTRLGEELQHEIERRIKYNINHIDYSKGEYEYDSEVKVSKKVQQRL